MRTIIFLTISFLCMLVLIPAKSQNNIPGNFFQMVDVSAYQGKPFTLECWLFADRGDRNSGSSLIAISMGNGKQLNNLVGKLDMESFKPGEWNKLVLSGKIDKRAEKLAVGALYSGKAGFFYDDIKLTINDKGIQTEIPLINADFENKDISSWKFVNTPKTVNIATTNQKAHSGSLSLLINAADTETSGFGNNNSTGHYADINGIKIYYETYGKGEPLLLLHGALESIQSFDQQIGDLSEHFKIIAVDTRGHGKSTEDGTLLTYVLYADDMYKLLDALKLDNVNVLGWSDGGNTGLILAMKHPDKIKKLAVMGANLYNDKSSVYDWVNDTIRNQIKEMEQAGAKSNNFELRVKKSLLTQPDINPQALKMIKCPALIMAGENDVIKEAHTRLISDNIPGSRLLIFKGASHDMPREDPKRFNRAVIDFFSN